MFLYMNKTVNPDLLFWTGDNVAHNVWTGSNEEVIESVTNITKTI